MASCIYIYICINIIYYIYKCIYIHPNAKKKQNKSPRAVENGLLAGWADISAWRRSLGASTVEGPGPLKGPTGPSEGPRVGSI